MSRPLQSWTPTAHALNYDALAGAIGCEPETGVVFFNIQPFGTLCVFEHDATDYWFNQPSTVSYQLGPTVQATTAEQMTQWVVWQGTEALRIGILGYVIPPADNLGVISTLGANVKGATGITHAFDANGLLHLAWEKPASPNFVELRRYTNTGGASASVSFAGRQPMLFNVNNLVPGLGVVCYYLRADQPNQLFARFSNDNFNFEHNVNPDLRVNLTRLFRIRAIGNFAKLYGRDELGRDITLTGIPQGLTIPGKTKINATFASGTMFNITAPAAPTSSKSKFTCTFIKGATYDGTAEAANPAREDAKFNVGFEFGDMIISQSQL